MCKEKQDMYIVYCTHLYEPSDKLYERRQHGHVSDFFYHQHRQWIPVPRQTLTGRILNGPGEGGEKKRYDG